MQLQHKPPHLPKHGDAWSNHTRNKRQRFEADDWRVSHPTTFLKHGMCSRPDTQNSPCRTPQRLPLGNFIKRTVVSLFLQ